MRRPKGSSAELWIGDISRLFGIDPRVTQTYWSQKHRLVRPTVISTARGGRHVYGPREIVKLIMAKQLAEDGMMLDEIGRVISWMETAPVKMIVYPHDPADLAITDKSRGMRRDQKVDQQDTWQTITFDPFPDPEMVAKCFIRQRGYPIPPSSTKAWMLYWRKVAQFVPVDRYRTGLDSLQVLIPIRWLHAEQGRFNNIRRWCNRVTGELAIEPVLRDEHAPLSTIRMIDVAMIKCQVAETLLTL
ncbi:MerR family transcriptional regulator [Gemmatimonadota bacterium]